MRCARNLTVAAAAALSLAVFADRAHAQDWLSAGNGNTDDRAAFGETVLTRGNVGRLAPIWTLATSGDVDDTPTVEGDAVYVTDAGGSVWRVNRASGAPVWQRKLAALTGKPGAYSRNSPAIGPSSIVLGDQTSATVYALDKASGALLWSTTLDHAPGAIITASPLIDSGRVYLGTASNQEEYAATKKGFVPSFRGAVAALDLASGHVLWQTYMVPSGFTGGAVWGSNLALDHARHALFVGTGDNYSVPPAVAACQAGARDNRALDACLPAADHIDSVLSIDARSGRLNWSRRMQALDTWTVSCIASARPPATPCPEPHGQDLDFGSAPNLFKSLASATGRDLVGAGQKSGAYWAFDRDTGGIVWGTQVNPGGTRGGIEWGSAVLSGRIYVAASNSAWTWTGLVGSRMLTNGGFWSALDAASGQIVWQTPTLARQPKVAIPSGRAVPPPPHAFARTEGAVSVANGVMFGADSAGNFVALDGQTGRQLWTFASGGAAIDAPAIAGGMVFWGDGYGGIGPSNSKLYAFGLNAP